MTDNNTKKRVVKLVWSTQSGFYDEKRLVSPEDLDNLQKIYEAKKPTEKGFLIFLGEPT